MLRLLVVEGNSGEILKRTEKAGMKTAADCYREALLLHVGDVQIDVSIPYAPELQNGQINLANYDGFALTGSGVSWSSCDAQAKPYLDHLSEIFAQGKPVIGSCWGMQTVAQLFGGHSEPNEMGTEVGIAQDIRLTPQGREHYVFDGMPDTFSSPCIHRDHVTRMPEGFEILAQNAVSPVQAIASIRSGIDYVGFQFHPEFELEYIKQIVDLRGGFPDSITRIESYEACGMAFLTRPECRTRVFSNWIRHVENKKAASSTKAA